MPASVRVPMRHASTAHAQYFANSSRANAARSTNPDQSSQAGFRSGRLLSAHAATPPQTQTKPCADVVSIARYATPTPPRPVRLPAPPCVPSPARLTHQDTEAAANVPAPQPTTEIGNRAMKMKRAPTSHQAPCFHWPRLLATSSQPAEPESDLAENHGAVGPAESERI
ncbi:MAG: hypothetical protein H6R19_1274 [Proteobacteria bacterium]|nr:hypothetical protein [Pseudomonadota bacterium]